MAGGAAARRRPGPEDEECSGRAQGQSRGGMARVPHRGLRTAGLATVWTEKRVWEVSPSWQYSQGLCLEYSVLSAAWGHGPSLSTTGN